MSINNGGVVVLLSPKTQIKTRILATVSLNLGLSKQ
jgi:hypothetical protein